MKKVYVLMISRVFPKQHPRAGDQTQFIPKIIAACGGEVMYEFNGKKYLYDRKKDYEEQCFINGWTPKRHTIRSNYDLWKKRADKINAGEAVLSLRQWSGKPYASKQIEFMQLENINVQPVKIYDCRLKVDRGKNKNLYATTGDRHIIFNDLVKNDGLNFRDFCDWFRIDHGKYLFQFEGCIINFTDHKY